VDMPIIGFGTFGLTDYNECKQAVLAAINSGYRLFDTAVFYGSDRAVGDAIKESGVPREELFISSKVWVSHMSYEKAKEWLQIALDNLGLTYLDMLLIHNPQGDVHGTWRAMEEMHDEGSVRSIGLSNFYPDRVMDVMLYNRIKPAIDQLETHVFHQRKEEHTFLKELGIVHEGWAPLAQGEKGIFTNKTLVEIGAKYGKTAAQVSLRWNIQRGVVVIPRAADADLIKENINIFDFQLSDDDMALISEMDNHKTLFFDNRDPKIIEIFYNLGKEI
ncbi:MAG: aldo/keto reductase, partial [Mangrovibacterium sp.]